MDPSPVHESPHPPLPATEPASRLSSEEGEGDDKEESVEKLDCHYSGHHPQPASVSATPTPALTRPKWGSPGLHAFHLGPSRAFPFLSMDLRVGIAAAVLHGLPLTSRMCHRRT